MPFRTLFPPRCHWCGSVDPHVRRLHRDVGGLCNHPFHSPNAKPVYGEA